MSDKKQIISLFKLSSIYEEVPEKSLDETDVDSCFHHNTFDTSVSERQIVRVN